MKARKGAKPVPGPIMMTGTVGLLGNLSVDLRMNSGTVTGTSLSAPLGSLSAASTFKISLRQECAFEIIRADTLNMALIDLILKNHRRHCYRVGVGAR